MNENADEIFQRHVFYECSKEEIAKEYNEISKVWCKDGVKFYLSNNDEFKKNLLSVLKNDNELSSFFTDTCILLDEIKENEISNLFLSHRDLLCFSLRLGENIKFCSRMNCNNVFKSEFDEGDKVFWEWQKLHLDFGYPFTVEGGHTFRSDDLRKMIRSISFKNFIEIEENLLVFDNFPKKLMCSYKHGKLINKTPENLDMSSEVMREQLGDVDRFYYTFK